MKYTVLTVIATSVFLATLIIASATFHGSEMTINTQGSLTSPLNSAFDITQLNDAGKEGVGRVQHGTRYQTTEKTQTFGFANQTLQISLNASTYKPGQTASINVTAPANELNGSISWSLESPLGPDDSFFNFKKEVTGTLFDDPEIAQAPNIRDWVNNDTNGFTSISAHQANVSLTSNGLILQSNTNTTSPGTSVMDFNHSILPGQYRIQFNYAAKGDSAPGNLAAWNGTGYRNSTVPFGGQIDFPVVLSTFTANITVGSGNSSKLQFSLSGANSTWLLTNFKLYYNYEPIQFNMLSSAEKKGSLLELHRQIQDMNTTNEIIANYSVAFISIKDRAYANLTLQLPRQQLILGYWRLTVVVSTLKSVGQGFEPTGQTTTYHVPINISDSLSFGQQFTFIQRGYNQSVDLPIFVDETNRSHIFSPTDNFTLVGSLSYETTGESFDSTYFARTSGVIEVNTSLSNLATLDWSQPSALQVHNQSGRFVWEGNFSNLAGANPKRTWGINFVVPTRGLFGNVSSSLEITFPNDLLFNDTTTPSSLQIPILTTIDEFTIRFTSALTTETLPFSNVFYLTQFVEGGFEINTTRHDVSFINATYPNNNISAQLEIPLSDLSFDVFLAERGTSNSKMKFLISQQGSGFTYSSRIDPNLPVPQDYDLRISWIDPTYVNDTVASVIAFLSTQSPVFRVSLRGSLSVQFPAETLSAPQGSNLLIRFNVSVDELGVPARGLRAFGVICGSTESCSTNNSHLPIAEKDGEFTLYYTVGTDVEMGEYQIILYTEAGLELGSIKVIITAQEIGPVFQTIVEPELTVIVGALLLAGITLTYLGIVFVKFR